MNKTSKMNNQFNKYKPDIVDMLFSKIIYFMGLELKLSYNHYLCFTCLFEGICFRFYLRQHSRTDKTSVVYIRDMEELIEFVLHYLRGL